MNTLTLSQQNISRGILSGALGAQPQKIFPAMRAGVGGGPFFRPLAFFFSFSFFFIFSISASAASYIPWNPAFAHWYPVVESGYSVALSSAQPTALPFSRPQLTPAVSPMFISAPEAGQGTLFLAQPYFATSTPVTSGALFAQVSGGNPAPLNLDYAGPLPSQILALKTAAAVFILSPAAQHTPDLEALTAAALKNYPAGQYTLRLFYR